MSERASVKALGEITAVIDESVMTRTRRLDRLGIHSVGEFHMTVPSLADAERFYSAFGLDVGHEPTGLTLRASGNDHVWGRLTSGERKKFERLTLNCFEDEVERLHAHILAQGVIPEKHDASGLWFRDPDGFLLQVTAGPKTTLDQVVHRTPELPVIGTRCAPYRSAARASYPQRLSHVVRLTRSVPRQVDFYTRVLGLRLSDHSGDGVAFLHGPHGSDHHLLAFAMSDGPALHHLSWDVPTVEDVGAGMMRMHAAGYREGWGVGRHVLGSNYFYYARDPWGSYCEFSATMDYIPAELDWEPLDHLPEDSFYLWGPSFEPAFLMNSESPL
jgi:catechol 2,3-dioxygenase-like lactoylglutathione lyase family enzyme